MNMDTCVFSNTFLIFTDQVIKKIFQVHKKELSNFFMVIGNANYGTIFLPENIDGFYEKMETLIIQLNYPVMLNIEDVVNNRKFSSSRLENVINSRKVKIKKGIVIAGHEQEFLFFDENFEFILVDSLKTAGRSGGYVIVNKLMDVLGILTSIKMSTNQH